MNNVCVSPSLYKKTSGCVHTGECCHVFKTIHRNVGVAVSMHMHVFKTIH